jgi:hypothetical protein
MSETRIAAGEAAARTRRRAGGRKALLQQTPIDRIPVFSAKGVEKSMATPESVLDRNSRPGPREEEGLAVSGN